MVGQERREGSQERRKRRFTSIEEWSPRGEVLSRLLTEDAGIPAPAMGKEARSREDRSFAEGRSNEQGACISTWASLTPAVPWGIMGVPRWTDHYHPDPLPLLRIRVPLIFRWTLGALDREAWAPCPVGPRLTSARPGQHP